MPRWRTIPWPQRAVSEVWRRTLPKLGREVFLLWPPAPWDPSAFRADVIFLLFLGRLFFLGCSEGGGDGGSAVVLPSVLWTSLILQPQGPSAGFGY